MAAGHSDYTRGEMPVEAQRGTFQGFMNWTIYGGAFIVIVLLMPTLVFGANMTWMSALIATVVVGIVLGIALKLKGAWYAVVIGMAIITALLCLLFTAIV